MRVTATVFALAAIGAAPVARAATHDTQFWIGEAITLNADDNDSITFDSSQRARADRTSGGEQWLARLTIDHKIAPRVQLGGGFAYFHGQGDQELRFHQQLTASHGILQSRTRLEERFFDYADAAAWRLRERVQIAPALDRAGRWTAVAAAEAFFSLNRLRPSERTGLAAFRLQAGVRRALSRHVDMQLLYMRQQTVRDGRPDVVNHVPWLTLNWRL